MIKSKNNNSESLEISLINSLASEGLKIIPNTIEIALDSKLKEGLLKEVPVIGSLIKIVQAGINVRDELFLEKILLFLKELGKVSRTERKKFAQKLDKNPDFKQKTGEALLLLLERLNDMEKPIIVAKIFAQHIKEKIGFMTMKRLAIIVDQADLSDLQYLAQNVSNPNVSYMIGVPVKARLFNLGLMSVIGISKRGSFDDYGKDFFEYSVNQEGKLLSEIAFDDSGKKKV
ncbi:MAG: hypothetical protein HQ536_01565 [Parcubacteria group bacterium]|nr:hypothetical protein [Parcubacteria group bacterium]